MKCPSLETLSAYIEGTLDAEKTAIIEKHLSQCSACQIELEMFGSVDMVLKDCFEYEQRFSTQTLAREGKLPDVPEDLKRQTLDTIMRKEEKAIRSESSESILSIVIEFIHEGLHLLSPIDDSLRFATSVVRGERDIESEASSMEISKDLKEHGISLSMLLEKVRTDRASLALTLTKLKSIEAITNVMVSIKGTRYPIQTTDANGQVRFRNLKKGTYQIELQRKDEIPMASIELTLQ